MKDYKNVPTTSHYYNKSLLASLLSFMAFIWFIVIMSVILILSGPSETMPDSLNNPFATIEKTLK